MSYTEASCDPAEGPYRYRLTRAWGPGARMVWVLLNPSTANGLKDDATIRRCVGYAKRWRYDGIVVVNLFGMRDTKQRKLRAAADPYGPDNDAAVWVAVEQAKTAGAPVVIAWGANGALHDAGRRRAEAIATQLGRAPDCLGRTKEGQPRHPLRLAAAEPLVPYGEAIAKPSLGVVLLKSFLGL